MKNFNILGAHRKIRVLKGGFHEKPIYRGDCLKRGEGFDTPMHTMVSQCTL